MGMVDDANRVNFYDGQIRVVTPEGKEWKKFKANDYASVIAEHVEPWSYAKFCYLKPLGWKGFTDGDDTSIYSVAPLARLNAADGMATPLAQKEYERFFAKLAANLCTIRLPITGHDSSNCSMRRNDARACRRQPAAGTGIPHLANRDPNEGVGVVEAPRGTLIHHYQTDEHACATRQSHCGHQNNAARIAMSVDKAAKGLIHRGEVPREF